MDDATILHHIKELIDEEHRLRDADPGHPVDTARLRSLEEQLDQAWDLLRQRRARAEFGEDPDAAAERPPSEVENYLN
jgi:hypothetical protein